MLIPCLNLHPGIPPCLNTSNVNVNPIALQNTYANFSRLNTSNVNVNRYLYLNYQLYI